MHVARGQSTPISLRSEYRGHHPWTPRLDVNPVPGKSKQVHLNEAREGMGCSVLVAEDHQNMMGETN